MAKIILSRAFRRPRKSKNGFFLSNPQVTISGVAGSGLAGTPFAEIDTGALTGVVGTGAAGIAVAQVSATTTGVFGTGQVGVLTIQQGPIGVQGNGQVGNVSIVVSITLQSVVGTGQAGTPFGIDGILISGVSATGHAGTAYPIPPAPTRRPSLYIPEQNGLPASLWLGSDG